MLGLRASSTRPFVDTPLIGPPSVSSDWPTHSTLTSRFFSPLFLGAARACICFVDDEEDVSTARHRFLSSSSSSSSPPAASPSSSSSTASSSFSSAVRVRVPSRSFGKRLRSRRWPNSDPSSIASSSAPDHTPSFSPSAAAAASPGQSFAHVNRGRLDGGRADTVIPTASHAGLASPTSPDQASLNLNLNLNLNFNLHPNPQSPLNGNRRLNTISQQPIYPGASPPAPDLAVAAAAALHQSPPRYPREPPATPPAVLSSPFRGFAGSSRPRRLSAARLWNPTNSTPRANPARRRRPSTPPPPSVPLQHPTLDKDLIDPTGTSGGDYPLLTLPQQRQIRHSGSPRASLQIEHSGTSDHRVSLPRSLRASYDGKRSQRSSQRIEESESGPSAGLWLQPYDVSDPTKLDKGKGKGIMTQDDEGPRGTFSQDLERGPDIMDPRHSNVSAVDGIGSALSSTNSSIMGEDVQPDAGGEWGPQHPCFPHLNPHVPIDSAEYVTTRIIRVRRDWLLAGDLAPTFSNLYPEILDPAGLSEQEFRRVVEKLNSVLEPAFNPYSLRNVVDGVLGLFTGWLWDDFGLTGIKTQLNDLEKWIEKWNLEMEKTMGSEEGAIAPKLISLRRTGYMSLDIQIPDPEIAPAPSTTNDSQTALPLQPAPVHDRLI